jgi:peroxiredoxin
MYNLGNTYDLEINQLIKKFKISFDNAGETSNLLNNLLKEGEISINEFNLLNNKLKDITLAKQEKQKSIVIK